MRYFLYSWHSLRKLLYFCKDIIFYLFLFGLGFLIGSGIIKVHASEERILNYNELLNSFKTNDYNQYYNSTCSTNVKSQLDELEKALEESKMNYIFLINFSTSRKNFDITLREYSGSEISLNVEKNSSSSYIFRASEKYLTNVSLDYTSFNCSNNNQMKVLIDYIKENNHLPKNSTSDYETYKPWRIEGYQYAGTMFSWLHLESASSDIITGNTIIYNTSMTMKLGSLGEFYGISAGDNVYRSNSSFPSYRHLPGYGKTYYSFYDNISTNNVSQVRFKFDVPNNQVIDFFFNYSVTFPTKFFETAPYLQYKTEDNRLIEHTYNLPLTRYTHSLDKIVYSDTQTNILSDVISLEFVVDLEQFRDTDEEVQIFFESEYPYTYELINESFYQTIDWTSNYAIMLIPKLYNIELFHTNEVYSAVYYKAKDINIALYDSLDTSNATKQFTNLSALDKFHHINYLFRSDNKNQLLFFANPNYLSSIDQTVIKYDTRFFVHSLCKSEFECESIINPNTNEEIKIKPPTHFIYDDESDDYTFNSVVRKLKQFINDLHETLDPIAQTIQYFYNQLPSLIQNFLIAIYTTFLLFTLYKILRR